MRCMTTTSSHRPSLRPTSRSVPTISKPQRRCSEIDGVVPADDPGDHRVVAVLLCQSDELREQLTTDAGPAVVAAHVDRVLDRR